MTSVWNEFTVCQKSICSPQTSSHLSDFVKRHALLSTYYELKQPERVCYCEEEEKGKHGGRYVLLRKTFNYSFMSYGVVLVL